jgi:hypothetical protein
MSKTASGTESYFFCKKPHHFDGLFYLLFLYKRVALFITSSQIFSILLSLLFCERFYFIGTYNRSSNLSDKSRYSYSQMCFYIFNEKIEVVLPSYTSLRSVNEGCGENNKYRSLILLNDGCNDTKKHFVFIEGYSPALASI